MRSTQSWLAFGAIVVTMVLPNASWAGTSVDSRIERLENIIENQTTFDLLTQIDNMQKEVQELRGKVEEQQNEIHLLTQKQEKIFVNLDSRLSNLNKNEPAATNIPNTPEQPKPENSATETINPTPQPTILPAGQNEKSSYDAAYKLIGTKQFPEAITAFKDFLWQYPDGTYAPNAYYWLGEIYVAQWQQNHSDANLLQQAIDSFNTVMNQYPNHHKAVDALLKLGLVEVEQEHWTAAQDILSQVINKYPDTSRARIAEGKIEHMRTEGHI